MKFFDGALEIVTVRLDVPAAGAEACLSEEERRRADRLVFERDRRRFVVRRAQLRRHLGDRLGVPARDVELVLEANGKPAVPDSNLRFNASHSGETAVFAFCEGREVGIDIEMIRDLPEADAVAARSFSPAELAAYLALDPEARRGGFFRTWTRREAFAKATGKGLLFPAEDESGWTVRDLVPAPGLAGAVVVQELAVAHA